MHYIVFPIKWHPETGRLFRYTLSKERNIGVMALVGFSCDSGKGGTKALVVNRDACYLVDHEKFKLLFLAFQLRSSIHIGSINWKALCGPCHKRIWLSNLNRHLCCCRIPSKYSFFQAISHELWQKCPLIIEFFLTVDYISPIFFIFFSADYVKLPKLDIIVSE